MIDSTKFESRWPLLAAALLFTAISACNTAQIAVRPPIMRARHLEAAPSLAQQALAKKNCGDFGVPKIDQTQNFGPTTIIYRNGYVLEHSGTYKIPLWVCEGFDRTQWDPPNPNRKDKFKPEPLVPSGQRAELADYKGSKMDRGHQAPAADFSDQTMKDESFFLSNMAPQSPPLNQAFWRLLEDKVRNWATTNSPINVFTGGFFYDPKEEDPATANGRIKYRLIGPNEVAVPTHFYKVVFARDENGAPRAIGFVVENRPYDKTSKFEDVIKSIEWIEERTGITFMPQLDDALQAKLKRTPGRMW